MAKAHLKEGQLEERGADDKVTMRIHNNTLASPVVHAPHFHAARDNILIVDDVPGVRYAGLVLPRKTVVAHPRAAKGVHLDLHRALNYVNKWD